jgi:hypothetical protein
MNEEIFHGYSQHGQLAFMEMVVRYMKAGLIHSQRYCRMCNFPMRLCFAAWKDRRHDYTKNKHWVGRKSNDWDKTKCYDYNDLQWFCLVCKDRSFFAYSTITCQNRVLRFDHCLRLYLT